MKAVQMYNVEFVSGKVVKEIPLRNKTKELCKWWIKQNASRYTNGKLIIKAI